MGSILNFLEEPEPGVLHKTQELPNTGNFQFWAVLTHCLKTGTGFDPGSQ